MMSSSWEHNGTMRQSSRLGMVSLLLVLAAAMTLFTTNTVRARSSGTVPSEPEQQNETAATLAGSRNVPAAKFESYGQSVRTPIVLVPGIMGSWSKKGHASFFSPPGTLEPDDLCFTSDPQADLPPPIAPEYALAPGLIEAIGKAAVDCWSELIAKLESADYGYQVDVDLFKAPYDWRLSVHDAAEKYLKPVIENAAATASGGRVHVIAHSMGGLVARAYIQGESYAGDMIDRLIMVGTPNHGASKAYPVWEAADGYTAYGSLLGSAQSIYLTLFMKRSSSDPFNRNSRAVFLRDVMPGVGELTPTFGFIFRDDSLVPPSSMELQNRVLNELNAASNVVRLSERADAEIVGAYARDTWELLYVYEDPVLRLLLPDCYPDGWPDVDRADGWIMFGAGDGTVLRESAELESVPAIFLDDPNLTHGKLPNQLSDLILESLTGRPPSRQAVLKQLLFEPDILVLLLDGVGSFLVTDPLGRRLGYDTSSGAELYEVGYGGWSWQEDLAVITILSPVPGEYHVVASDTSGETYRIGCEYSNFDGSLGVTIYHSFRCQQGESYERTVTLDPEGEARDVLQIDEPPPTATFSWAQVEGTLTVQFTDESTGEIDTRLWDFGDGSMSTGQTPAHEYASPADYDVTLTVTGPGGSDSVSESVSVSEVVGPQAGRSRGGAGAPCFVATAAYGTPIAEQVRVLCEFRDSYLMSTRLGCTFVKAYYRFSPRTAQLIARHKGLRKAVGAALIPVVGAGRLALSSQVRTDTFVAMTVFCVCVIAGRHFALRRKNKFSVTK